MINELNAIGYCKDDISLIENYDKAVADTTQMWICHHKNEITMNLSANELILLRKYYQVPASELIFLTASDHRGVHNKSKFMRNVASKSRRRSKASDETRRKLSESHKGKSPWNKGCKLSVKHRQNISESLKKKNPGT